MGRSGGGYTKAREKEGSFDRRRGRQRHRYLTPVFGGSKAAPLSTNPGPQHPTLPPGAAPWCCPLPALQRKDRRTAPVEADLTVTWPPHKAT